MDAAAISDFERAFALVETYRGRAYHAKMGADEAASAKIKSIFERLAASYEALAEEVERLKKDEHTRFAVSPEAVQHAIERLCAVDPDAKLATQETLQRLFQKPR